MGENENEKTDSKDPSVTMTSLVVWNITKALENNRNLDLLIVLKQLEDSVKNRSEGLSGVTTANTVERYLTCALLAWQQLGHSHAESLHRFYAGKIQEAEATKNSWKNQIDKKISKQMSFIGYKDASLSTASCYSVAGPVVKLPVETKLIMRVDPPKSRTNTKPTSEKLAVQCCATKVKPSCNKSKCDERLAEMDKKTAELRARAEKLAKREAHRVELLERAENAWGDLERGYQRRIALAAEKENSISRQLNSLIEERNNYKESAKALVEDLKKLGDGAEKDRVRLTEMEKKVCQLAKEKLTASNAVVAAGMALAKMQSKLAHHSSSLQVSAIDLKEEQAKRNLESLKNELESFQALQYQGESMMKKEQNALREKMQSILDQIENEKSNIEDIKAEIKILDQEKLKLLEGVENCKKECDAGIQSIAEDLRKKKLQLVELKEKIIECKCKLPVDATVAVKRTASLAAACNCRSVADSNLEACSCTSIRTRLLLNLYADLFGGLTQMLGDTGSQMPCQMLKCFEDQHNWDKATVLKRNLFKYFEGLINGELDIAITNSIENYHAQWVGASCVDKFSSKSRKDAVSCGGEQSKQKQMEDRAKTLATKLGQQLAKQLFQDQSPSCGSPAVCDCGHSASPAKGGKESVAFHFQIENDRIPTVMHKKNTGVTANIDEPQYKETKDKALETMHPTSPITCLKNNRVHAVTNFDIKAPKATGAPKFNIKEPKVPGVSNYVIKVPKDTRGTTTKATIAAVWKKTNEDIVLLRSEISDMKKDFVNKADLKSMEKKILKHARPKKLEKSDNGHYVCNVDWSPMQEIRSKHNSIIQRATKCDISLPSLKKPQKNIFKTKEPTFTVNLCLCDQRNETFLSNTQSGKVVKTKFSKNRSSLRKLSEITSFKQTKPVRAAFCINNGKVSNQSSQNLCEGSHACFHKIPSTSSIDNLLKTLGEWNCNLVISRSKVVKTEKTGVPTDNIKLFNDSTIAKTLKENKPEMFQNILDEELTKLLLPDHKNIRSYSTKISNKESNKGDNWSPITQGLITGIHSEYMGAVNLDKSNDQIYRCLNDNDVKIIENVKYPIESNNSCLHKSNIQDKVNDLPKTINKISQKQVSVQVSAINTVHRHQTTKTSNMIVNPDYDYHIKFLGVTLDDMDISHKEKEYIFASEQMDLTDCLAPDNKLNSLEDSFKDNIVNSLTESCVCCNVKNVKEKKSLSTELEQNTFDLLQSHLKKKIIQFKKHSLDTNFLTPLQERNIYDSIINRVKDFIADNLTSVSCTCGDSNDSSWNRVHYLLQEYLKTKVSRLQCHCYSGKKDSESVVPNLLNKITEMIDEDFKKLSFMCNNKSSVVDIKTDLSNKFVFDKENNTDICGDVKYLTPTQHVSSQMQPSLKTITVSCNDIERVSQHSMAAGIDHLPFNDITTSYTAVEMEHKICGSSKQQIKICDKNEFFSSCACRLCSEPALETTLIHFPKLNDNYAPYDDVKCTEIINDNKVLSAKTNTVSKERYSYVGKLERCICTNSLNTDKVPKNNKLGEKIPETQASKTYNMDVTTDEGEEIILKKFNSHQNKINHETNTSTKHLHPIKHLDIEQRRSLNNIGTKTEHLSKNKYLQSFSEGILEYGSESDSGKCNCELVPICQVKILVEDIERNLLNSKCTCDSLSRAVCPVHSSKYSY